MFRKCILHFVPDDVQQESAHSCSRQAIYGMLEEPAELLTVEEIKRVHEWSDGFNLLMCLYRGCFR